MAKRVIIVRLDHLADDFGELAASLIAAINSWTVKDPATQQEVAAASAEAMSRQEAWPERERADCVIFMSGTQVKVANSFKQNCPGLKVMIIATGQVAGCDHRIIVVHYKPGADMDAELRSKILAK